MTAGEHMHGVFINVEIDEAIRRDTALAEKLTEVSFGLDRLSLGEVAARLQLPIEFGEGRINGKVVAAFGGGPARVRANLAIPGAKSLPPDVPILTGGICLAWLSCA